MNWDNKIFHEINSSWFEFFKSEYNKENFQSIFSFLNSSIEKKVFPSKKDVFNAFKITPLSKVSVVILGQDPYHGLNQAHGLAFSVKKGTQLPPSLVNIFKELKDDIGVEKNIGNLSEWARQGVLLINNTLTVSQGQANSHKDIGWNIFTNNLIEYLDKNVQPVFVLWGGFAQSKIPLIKRSNIIKSPHPSPLSAYRGFFGSKPFSKINNLLKVKGIKQIKW